MRWLLLKDLRILRRSPLLVALLVLYPVVIAVLIGFALSRGPDKPKVAFYNGLAGEGTTVVYATHHIPEADRYADQLIVLADGERVFDGSPRELEQATGTTGLDFERAFVAYLQQRGH